MALEADSRRPKRDRRTALMLFEAIKEDGYTGGYSILTDYVRNWRNGSTLGSGKFAFVPLKFQLGDHLSLFYNAKLADNLGYVAADHW